MQHRDASAKGRGRFKQEEDGKGKSKGGKRKKEERRAMPASLLLVDDYLNFFSKKSFNCDSHLMIQGL